MSQSVAQWGRRSFDSWAGNFTIYFSIHCYLFVFLANGREDFVHNRIGPTEVPWSEKPSLRHWRRVMLKRCTNAVNWVDVPYLLIVAAWHSVFSLALKLTFAVLCVIVDIVSLFPNEWFTLENILTFKELNNCSN